ncbi:Peptidoglycan/LPS O-acetylase OafA/YrhL, contains acyltransferase and SGNH-hydrolase domains [Novosphingobium sp. CF614]|uniref:acyltransferase family protein n=1 Tax=Novosphingobium sp. CF614 TaxID=1884364 RepID=UPI0008E7F1DC|nr:acyltransferase [Novosphingobium sp. CF614]SFG19942.1 Peptidoglycan/LPS O-acetylase OafA/YrhL, contains acyltransferase and SGNH-hydrolase domains [Novosphingobium sp. CF614]
MTAEISDKFAVKRISARESVALNVMRGGAALLVLFEHCKNRVFGENSDFVEFGQLSVIPRLIFNLGHEAVIVFFVLSGYLVGRKLLQTQNAQEATRYFIDRISRIYLVAIPAVIFSALVAAALMATLGISFSQPDRPENCNPDLIDIVGNLVLLNKTVLPTICSNSPFWSIQNEMTYYVFFGVVFMTLYVWKSVRAKIAGFGIAALIVGLMAFEPLNPNNTILYSGFWLAGTLASMESRKSYLGLVCLGLTYAALLAFGVRLNGQFVIDVVIMIVIVAAVLLAGKVKLPSQISLPAKRLSDISFSLYLFHMPVVNALVSIFIYFGIEPGHFSIKVFSGWFIIFCYATAAIIFSILMYVCFESRTNDVRKWLLGHLGKVRLAYA